MSWLIKRGSIYYVGYKDGTKDKYVTTKSSDPIVAEQCRLKAELAQTIKQGPVVEPKLDMKMDALAELYTNEADIKPETLRINRYSWSKLKGFIDDKPIVSITTADIVAFKNYGIANDWSPASISLYLRDINKLLGFAVEKGLLKFNPCKKTGSRKWAVEHPEEEASWRFLTKEEEEKLLAVCNPLLRRMVVVALETGLRISQVVEMEWKRYDHSKRLYTVPKQKRQRVRLIPIMERALSAMGPLHIGGRVFPGTNQDQIEKMFTRAVRKSLGKGYCTFHDLRHTFVSRVCTYLNPVEVRDLMGWSSVALVDRYTHSRTTDIQSKMMNAQPGVQAVSQPSEAA